MAKIDRTGISKHRSYTIKELTARLKVSEKTIERWFDKGLLTVLGGRKPILILGDDLIEFLKNKDAEKKMKLKRNEFCCFGCKRPRRAKKASTKVLSDRKTGDCCVCGGKMSRLFTSRKNPLSDTASQDVNVGFDEPTPPPTP